MTWTLFTYYFYVFWCLSLLLRRNIMLPISAQIDCSYVPEENDGNVPALHATNGLATEKGM